MPRSRAAREADNDKRLDRLQEGILKMARDREALTSVLSSDRAHINSLIDDASCNPGAAIVRLSLVVLAVIEVLGERIIRLENRTGHVQR